MARTGPGILALIMKTDTIDDIELEFTELRHVHHYECEPCGLSCKEANLCPWCLIRMVAIYK